MREPQAPAQAENTDGRRRYFTIGAVGGLAGGLLGVGGGFIMVPLQILWARTPPHHASGNSLAAIVPIGIVAAAIYYFGGSSHQLDVVVALWVMAGSTLGSLVGSQLAPALPERVIERLLALLMLAGAAKELYDAVVGGGGAVLEGPAHLSTGGYVLLGLTGLVIGLLSGLTGVGGGILLVPTLVLGFGVGQRIAQGTSLVAIIPSSAVGAALHRRHGQVEDGAAARMAAGGLPASLLGAVLALWLPQRALAGLFGLLLVTMAVRFLRTRSD